MKPRPLFTSAVDTAPSPGRALKLWYGARQSLNTFATFWGALAFDLKFEALPSGEAPRCDGTTLAAPLREWCEASPEERQALVLRACVHGALGHYWRRGNRKPDVWDKATYRAAREVIGELAVDAWGEAICKALPPGDFDHAMGAEPGSAEQYYSRWKAPDNDGNEPKNNNTQGLARGMQVADGAGAKPPPGGDQPGGDQPGDGRTEADWQATLVQAAAQDQMQGGDGIGSLPGALQDILNAAQAPVVDWRSATEAFLRSTMRDPMRTLSRPNRRFLASGLYLPGTRRDDTLGGIAVILDVSGSIPPSALEAVAMLVADLADTLQPARLRILQCDTRVIEDDEYSLETGDGEGYAEQLEGYRVRRGGGTDMGPAFKRLATADNEWDGIICVTDMLIPPVSPAPDASTLWLHWGDKQGWRPTFGTVTPLKL